MDDTLPFDPRTIIWFHAVNTVGRWRATLSSIENTIEQQQVARTQHERLCFGVEIDVRLWQAVKPEAKAEECVLVLAHDPLTLSSTVATHGSDGDGQDHHMTLSDLMTKLSELKKKLATTSKAPVGFILKLDVKEPEALPILLDLLSGVYTFDPTTSRHCFKFSEHLELAPCQVWLNMDVVPLTQSDDGASSPCATHSVAEVALAYFRRAVHYLGVGLSLGWIIDPSFREWCINERREEDVSKRKDLKALRKGNHAMLSFVKRIFEDDTVKRQEGEIVTHHDSLVLITFALNFAIFIGDESALATLDELIRDTQRVIRDGGRRAVVFPTYWRARCDTISEGDETRLTVEISKFGHTCSVDKE